MVAPRTVPIRPVDQLDEPRGVPFRDGPVYPVHGPAANHDPFAELFPGLFLGITHVGHLRVGKGRPGDPVQDRTGSAGQERVAHRHEPLPGCVVGELVTTHAISGGVDVAPAGVKVAVHLDAFCGVGHPSIFQIKFRHVGLPPDG